ncbi:MAG: hypothetical protein DI537_53505, partial [Stutzerimonas stutzeri]
MAGIDRVTGRVISNLDSAFQGVEVTLTTRISSRVMLREFGGGVLELLGRAVTPALFAAWRQLIGTAIDLWEPRFRVRQIHVTGSVEELRVGTAGLRIEVDFRPRGHLGDETVERSLSFGVNFGSGQV